MDSLSAITGPEVLDGAADEQDAQAGRSPGKLAIASLVLVVLLGLVVLGAQYDKSAVWRDRVSSWWGAFSTVPSPVDNSSSISRSPERPEDKLPIDSIPEEVASDTVFEPELRQAVEPALTVVEEGSLELEAAVAVPVQQQGAGVQSNPEVAVAQASDLLAEASLDNSEQGIAMTLEDDGNSQAEYPAHSEDTIQAIVPAITAALEVDDGVDDSNAARIVPATEHVLHVEFGFDSAESSSESQSVLERALDLLNSTQGSRALIVGYSDSQGKDPYNLMLSRRRAETVAQYLIDKGIQRTSLQVEGRGAIQISENLWEQESMPSYNDWRIVEIRIVLPGTH